MPPPSAQPPEPGIGSAFSAFRLADAAGTVQLMLVGELDLLTADRARAALRWAQEETSTLVCDLGDVWFVDLSGLRALVDATAHARRIGGRLTFVNCPSIVPRMLAILEIEDALEIAVPARPAGPPAQRPARLRSDVG
jgi:anti-anti-sigma factor